MDKTADTASSCTPEARTLDPMFFPRINEVPDRKTLYRIEALRAASRVVAGLYDAKTQYNLISGGTLIVAEHFTKYLETGER